MACGVETGGRGAVDISCSIVIREAELFFGGNRETRNVRAGVNESPNKTKWRKHNFVFEVTKYVIQRRVVCIL